MNNYDLAIIGSGPCGYVAGIRAAQLGMNVCIFEKDNIGGICLNEGCIPTKALSASSMALYNIERAGEFGINVKEYALDFKKVSERKKNIIKKLSTGVETLLKTRKIAILKERAKIKDATHVQGSNTEVEARNILIATGSFPLELPNMPFDGTHILTSSSMLELEQIPKSIIIVGGGVIGCEFASIFRQFGSAITIIEMLGQLLPNEDEELAKKLEQIFQKRGIKVFTNKKVENIAKKQDSVNAVLSDGKILSAEKAVICVGRVPNSKNIGLDKVGIVCDKGWIKVDQFLRTSVRNIYAGGDVKGGWLLAHVASREGICAVEDIAGEKEVSMDYNVIPSCIFTNPEIASVGFSEAKAKGKGFSVCSRKFLFSSVGKSHILGEVDGFIKLVVDDTNDKILGSQIIGPHATELVAEISLCMQFGITSENLAKVVHAHPTLSEAIQEVSEAVNNRAIHSL